MQIKRAHAARIESRRGPARLTLRRIIINVFVIIPYRRSFRREGREARKSFAGAQ